MGQPAGCRACGPRVWKGKWEARSVGLASGLGLAPQMRAELVSTHELPRVAWVVICCPTTRLAHLSLARSDLTLIGFRQARSGSLGGGVAPPRRISASA